MAAVASGALLALAFPPVNGGPLVFLALVPLFAALHPRAGRPDERSVAAALAPGARAAHAFRLGVVAGAVWAGITFAWLPRLPAAQTTVPWLLVPAYAVLVAYLAAWVGLACLTLAWLLRWLDWPLPALAPAVWTALEYLRGSGALGLPWGSAGYALAPWPDWIQGASVVGLWGLGAWIVLVNALAASALLCRAWRGRILRGALLGGALVVPWLWGHARLARTPTSPVARVALLQGAVGAAVKWDPAYRDSTFRLYGALTRRAAAARPDIIVWPETAAPSYLTMEPMYLSMVSSLARAAGRPLLVGFPEPEVLADRTIAYYNTAGLFRPDGALDARYRKVHLVPFGEAIPGSTRFRILSRIDLGQGNFSPGRDTAPLDPDGTGRARLGVLICFESIFPSLARAAARRGSDYLVNITNDEWFGNTAAPEQHAWMAVLRAVETGRGVARCANTGLTWIVDPLGRVTGGLPPDRRGVLVGEVRRIAGTTAYVRAGDVAAWASLLVVALGLVLAVRRRRAIGRIAP